MAEQKSEQIKEEIVRIVREFASANPCIDSPLTNKAKELEWAIKQENESFLNDPVIRQKHYEGVALLFKLREDLAKAISGTSIPSDESLAMATDYISTKILGENLK